jgi:hypothetical protein
MNIDGGDFGRYGSGPIIDGGGFRPDPHTPLEKMRWLVARYPSADILESLSIDYTDQVPDMGGIFPQGLVEVARQADILGNVTVTNQLNFALYTVLTKAPEDDAGATYNAEWVFDFQQWVQEQSIARQAPTFGDVPHMEQIVAQNGEIYSADAEGVAIYAIQISAIYQKKYRRY